MTLLNKQIKNIIYTHKRTYANTGYNILYKPHDTFFDSAINYITSDIMTPICLENKNLIQNIFYSALWTNDIIDFSQRIPDYAEFYTQYILAIHSPPSPLLKREDINILKNRLHSYKILSFDQNKQSWPIDNISHISYGVPDLGDLDITKSKDILVINTKRQKQSHILYQYLKKAFPNTDMLELQSYDIENISKVLSQYKVCIDIENYYNLILANACGAYGITASDSFDDTIIKAKDYDDIVRVLPNLLLLGNRDAEAIRKNTLNKYDWNKFNQNINSYIKHIIAKDFTL